MRYIYYITVIALHNMKDISIVSREVETNLPITSTSEIQHLEREIGSQLVDENLSNARVAGLFLLRTEEE